MLHQDIDFRMYVEVQQPTIGHVNEYLEHGYVLLGVFNFQYVVGRTRAVEHWDPPPQSYTVGNKDLP